MVYHNRDFIRCGCGQPIVAAGFLHIGGHTVSHERHIIEESGSRRFGQPVAGARGAVIA